MYEYFPDNYAWSLTTSTMFDEVGTISEPEEALRQVRHLAGGDPAVANEAWYAALTRLAERLERLARADEAAGHPLSAARKWHRAGVYHLRAERMIFHTDPREIVAYRRGIAAYRRARELNRDPVEFVDVAWDGAVMPCLFVRAPVVGPAPCMVHIQGFDSLKEMHYPIIGEEYRRRGIHMLIADQPGAGGALRLYGLTTGQETEHFVGALVDYAAARDDVDAGRIALSGNSLGGYYALRAAAFEKRLAGCIAWGAIWDFSIYFERAFARIETAPSVPDMVRHAMWVFGQDTPEGAREVARAMTLDGVMEQITCPLFVVHGENDRQIPLWTAERTYEATVNAARRDLKIFRLDEGGAEHCQIDNRQLVADVMADWAAEVLGGAVAGVDAAA